MFLRELLRGWALCALALPGAAAWVLVTTGHVSEPLGGQLREAGYAGTAAEVRTAWGQTVPLATLREAGYTGTAEEIRAAWARDARVSSATTSAPKLLASLRQSHPPQPYGEYVVGWFNRRKPEVASPELREWLQDEVGRNWPVLSQVVEMDTEARRNLWAATRGGHGGDVRLRGMGALRTHFDFALLDAVLRGDGARAGAILSTMVDLAGLSLGHAWVSEQNDGAMALLVDRRRLEAVLERVPLDRDTLARLQAAFARHVPLDVGVVQRASLARVPLAIEELESVLSIRRVLDHRRQEFGGLMGAPFGRLEMLQIGNGALRFANVVGRSPALANGEPRTQMLADIRLRYGWEETPLARALNSRVWSEFHVRTACGLASAALAVELFSRDQGRYPNHLKELVPAYLPRIPQDWLGVEISAWGKHTVTPVRYALRRSRFVVYSKGVDGNDDGGRTLVEGGSSGRTHRRSGAVPGGVQVYSLDDVFEVRRRAFRGGGEGG